MVAGEFWTDDSDIEVEVDADRDEPSNEMQ